ncbi:MAG: DegT/DnrJ/EryC1/StrS family aminotransferase [Treponemataceae bacterium]|nr:DegT/DnrJ/EryC1/StrS family aminotransferase [Treponemataceae bacterium]
MSSAKPDFVPFFTPQLGPEEEAAVLRVMKSGWLTTGKEAAAFESEWSAYTGSPCSLAVNSNTSGLILAMEACGVKAGKKILTTPYTFISTATSARHLGGDIVYADLEPDTYSISPKAIEAALEKDPSITAVVPVHIAGNLCNMKEICDIAAHYGVRVIEDCAHAFPSRTAAGHAGTFGDAGVFSFYATKTITTGEGGMITTKDPELAKRMTTMRMHGIDRTVWDRYTSTKASWQYDVVDEGYKFNLPDILAAIGREQLKKAQTFYEMRKAVVDRYNEAFRDVDFLQVPPDGEGNAWHLYLLRIRAEKLTIDRNEFAQKLQDRGLGISMHFIPHYHFTHIRNLYGYTPDQFPNCERQFQSTVTIPLWPGMSEEQTRQVIDTVLAVGKEHYGC